MILSKRVASIENSRTVELATLIDKLKRDGKDIINLNVGEPDLDTPDSIKHATINAINNNRTKYSIVSGETKLRKKIAQDFSPQLSESNVLIGNGSKQILYSIFQSVCDPLDEVIIFCPYWGTLPESIKLAGGIPIYVETNEKNRIDFDSLNISITAKTKAILINSPNNPTGAIYPKEDLKKIAQIASEHNLLIISDEAYDYLDYTDTKNQSIAHLSSETFNRTITVKSFSKTFSMTGFRIGYLIASEEIVAGINKLQGHLSGNTATFIQYGAIAAMDIAKEEIELIISSFKKKRDLAYNLFSQIFRCERPDGALYLFCDVRNLLGDRYKTCDEFSSYLVEHALVAVVPGSAFGRNGFIRISFAQSEENIQEAFNRIKSII